MPAAEAFATERGDPCRRDVIGRTGIFWVVTDVAGRE